MPDQPAPRLRFNCYLLRGGLQNLEVALRPKYRESGPAALTRVEPSGSAPSGSVAFLGAGSERTPRWATELDSAYPGVAQALNTSNRLVIFLPVGDRWFAVCFGYGSSALEWDAIEANFGLRLAARRFRPSTVSELRSRRIDASARTQSVQVPAGAELRDLGVDLEGEFVRKLAGRVEESDVDLGDAGAVVAGDSIAFKASTDLEDVQRTLGRMLDAVNELDAQEEFLFVDSLEPLKTSSRTVRNLDELLAARILKTEPKDSSVAKLETHVLEFAPPDDVAMDEVEEFEVSNGDRRTRFSEPSLAHLREVLQEVGVRRGHSFLRGVRLIRTRRRRRGAEPTACSAALACLRGGRRSREVRPDSGQMVQAAREVHREAEQRSRKDP